MEETELGGSQGHYPTTVWTDVFRREDPSSDRVRAKLEGLLFRYWKPIYRTIRLSGRYRMEEAKDLTQAFFTKVLEDGTFSRYRPEKGRLRTYLRAALTYFLVKRSEAQRCLKRGGDRLHLSLNDDDWRDELEPSDPGREPGEVLDQEWAHSILEEAIRDLRIRLETERRFGWFDVFQAVDLHPGPDAPPSYEAVAERLGLRETQVTHFLHGARQALRETVIEKIREYTGSPDEVYDELRSLLGN